METGIFKEMISIIRAEQQRRVSLLAEEDPNFAYDRWLSTDEPLVNELCLMVLVTLSHQVERELVRLSAQKAEDGEEISRQQYQEKVRQERELLRRHGGRDRIIERLNLKLCRDFASTEVLRFLANSYKHDPSTEPDKVLLELLKLETRVNYAPLPESHSLQKGLAAFIGLGEDADYCGILERFVEIVSGFLADVRSQTRVSPVRWDPVSLNPDTFTR
jgi:hypothetical protein